MMSTAFYQGRAERQKPLENQRNAPPASSFSEYIYINLPSTFICGIPPRPGTPELTAPAGLKTRLQRDC